MKFQLAPYNWDLSDEVLLDDLRSVARTLGKAYVTKEEYNKLGRLCASTLQNRFGSWCKAHELAGLRKIRHYDATAEDCVNEVGKRGSGVVALDESEKGGRESEKGGRESLLLTKWASP